MTTRNRVQLPPGLFITGTGTDVGKTYVTALIARQLKREHVRVGAYKPACSGSVPDSCGLSRWPDVESLAAAISDKVPRERVCPQCLSAPLAPPVAARLEGRIVDSELLRSGAAWWNNRVDLLLVEGVGGLLCPLTHNESVADLAADFGLALIIVARSDLGTINHTLLTVEVALQRGLHIAGIVMNQISRCGESENAGNNAVEIAARTPVPILGTVEHGGDSLFRGDVQDAVDWKTLAGLPLE